MIHEIVIDTRYDVKRIMRTLLRLRLKPYEIDEFVSMTLMFVGEVIFQTFSEGIIDEGFFEETVSEALYETFYESTFNDVISDGQILGWVTDLYYRVAPTLVKMTTANGFIISGVGFARLIGYDSVYFFEETDLRH